MSSISVGLLKQRLETVPDDFEVIMELTSHGSSHGGSNGRKEGKTDKVTVADINGIRVEEAYREVRLMN